MPSIMGLHGVAADETPRAKKLAKIFEWPMVILAILILLEWYLEAQQQVSGNILLVTDWLVWGFFTFETCVLLALVKNRKAYLKGNWINLVIIVLAMPLLWEYLPHAGGLRALRLVVLFSLLIHVSSSARKLLARNHLGITLLVSFIIMLMAGTIMALIDPNVETPLDGIWWAWVTITTVGYGDIVPGSTAGRLFGSILILMGIGLFSMLTASFSVFFIAQGEEDIVSREKKAAVKLEHIESRLAGIEVQLKALLEHKNKPGN